MWNDMGLELKLYYLCQGMWNDMDLELKLHKETETFILVAVEDIQTMLDDHIVKTQSMRSSPFIKPIENDVVG